MTVLLRRFLLVVVIFFAWTSARTSGRTSAWAQGTLDTTLALPPVTVTAARFSTAATAPARVTVLGEEALERTGARTVAGLLEARSGLHVKRYGAGGLATLSLRGTSASQTLVLLDGHRIADPQLGQLDLSLLPTSLLEGAEVMHGAASAVHGTEGIGGVVNLRTRSPGAASRLVTSAGYGAYGERSGEVLASGTSGRLSGLALVAYGQEEGNFPYENEVLIPARTVRRRGADRQRLALYASGGYAGDRHRLRVSAWYHDAERGLPGTAATPPGGERQWDEHLRLWLDHRMLMDWGTLRLGGLLQRGALRYANPGLDLDDTGRTLIGSLEAEADLLPLGAWAWSAGATGSYGQALHPSLADVTVEGHGGAFVRGTGTYGRLRLYPALRTDVYVQPAGAPRAALSPRLGLNVRPFVERRLYLKASLGRAFRIPTFNDRFWQPGGNPNLRPERAWTADLGFFLQQRRHQIEFTAFASRVRDQILWTPTSAGYWAPENAQRVRTRGLEASWQWRYARAGRRLEGGAFYTFTDARDRSDPASGAYGKPLRYVPRKELKVHGSGGLGPFTLDLNGRYTGRRYVNRDGTGVLDPFFVLDGQARMERRFGDVRAQLALAVENLLDGRYAVVSGYPMPPRHARLRLLLEWRPAKDD